MRRRVWAVALFLVWTAVPVQGAQLTPLHGELDHQVDALVQGRLAAGTQSVLSSVADSNQPPIFAQFDLQAAEAEAVIVHAYAPSSGPSSPTTPTALLGLGEQSEDDIEYAGEDVERILYRGLTVLPKSATSLWNLLAYGHPDDVFEVQLAEGDHLLGQVRNAPHLVRSEIPRTKTVIEGIEPLDAILKDSLEVRPSVTGASYVGDFTLILYGADFDFKAANGQQKTVKTGPYQTTSSFRDGSILPENRQVNTVILLRVKQGTFTLNAEQSPVTLHAQSVEVDGLTTFKAPRGTLDWDGRAEAADAETRTLEGKFQLSPRGPAYEGPDGGVFSPLAIQGVGVAPSDGVPTLPLLVAAGALAAGAAVRWIPGVRRLAFAAVAGFSLVQKDEALEHRARSQLFEFVRANPGATMTVAQDHIGVGWGTVEYHVAVLERLGHIVTKRVGGKRLLFAAGQGRVIDPAAWSLMRNPSVRQLGATLLAPGRAATQVEVAQALDCSPQYAGRLLRKLAEAGLVQESMESPRRAYVSTELFYDLARRTGLVPAVEAPTVLATAPA